MTTSTISVIIPTVQPDGALMALLGQLSEMDIFETIIVKSKTTKTAFEVGQNCTWLTAPKGRGPQIQAGLDAAKGDIIWILHADSIIPENAISEINRIIQKPNLALGCFPLRFDHADLSLKLFAAFSNLPLQLTTFGDQGFFFRRELKNMLPDLTPYPLLEDVILYRALREKGAIVKADSAITTSANRFKRLGVWQTQWRNAEILWKFRQGVSAKKLYAEYYKDVSPRIKSATSLSGL